MAVQELRNEGILFEGFVRWLFLAAVCGVIVGAVVGLFLIVLYRGIDFINAHSESRYALIPLGLLASLFSIKLFCPQAAGHGTDKVIAAIHYKEALLSFSVVPVKIVSTIFTLAPGAVVGTEGPSVQIGAALMSALSRLFKLTVKERKKLVVCGVAAALSSVFGAPVAGAVFGVEVLFVGELFYPVLLPALVSAVVAYMVCVRINVPYTIYHVAVPALTPEMLEWCLFAAVCFGLVCILHIKLTDGVLSVFKRLSLPDWAKSLMASALILTVFFFFGDAPLGMGEKGLNSILAGQASPWYSFVLKSFLLGVTLGGGGSGGVLTPTFYIGAAAGALFASVFGLDTAFLGALGFVGCVAGSVNTPIAAVFLATELFGASIAPFAGIVCVISYMISGAHSLYPTQILIRPKSDEFVLADPQDKKSWRIRPIEK
ncbi:MAG: chloride channel protein [Alphaproteobacteria bacterium]|nr:chloride channel protein [Alphaproteobacteria bacterium]